MFTQIKCFPGYFISQRKTCKHLKSINNLIFEGKKKFLRTLHSKNPKDFKPLLSVTISMNHNSYIWSMHVS